MQELGACLLLMAQGVSSRAACLLVGIDQRTGKRWRGDSPASVRPLGFGDRVLGCRDSFDSAGDDRGGDGGWDTTRFVSGCTREGSF